MWLQWREPLGYKSQGRIYLGKGRVRAWTIRWGGSWVHSEGNRENRRRGGRRMSSGSGGSWDSLSYSLQTVKRLWGFPLILLCILRLLQSRNAVRSWLFLSIDTGLRDGAEERGGKNSRGSPTSIGVWMSMLTLSFPFDPLVLSSFEADFLIFHWFGNPKVTSHKLFGVK